MMKTFFEEIKVTGHKLVETVEFFRLPPVSA